MTLHGDHSLDDAGLNQGGLKLPLGESDVSNGPEGKQRRQTSVKAQRSDQAGGLCPAVATATGAAWHVVRLFPLSWKQKVKRIPGPGWWQGHTEQAGEQEPSAPPGDESASCPWAHAQLHPLNRISWET